MIVNISFRIDIDDFSADTNPCDARGSWFFRSNSSIIIFLYIYICLRSDINECSAVSNPCDEKADCGNSEGSYSCVCKQGFTGNGTACEGKKPYYYY